MTGTMDAFMQFFNDNLLLFYVVAFALLVGIEVISRAPASLYTPLLSGANAVSGVVLIGAILLVRQTRSDDYLSLFLGFTGIVAGMANAAGGFLLTDRLPEVFKKKKTDPET